MRMQREYIKIKHSLHHRYTAHCARMDEGKIYYHDLRDMQTNMEQNRNAVTAYDIFCIPALALLRARATTTHSTAAIRATTGSTAMTLRLSSAAFHVGACSRSGWGVSPGSMWDACPGSRGCSLSDLALKEEMIF